MASSHHHDAFLRVLAAAAWSDGRVAPEELNVIKRYAHDLGVGTEGWARLEPYLDEPIAASEAELLVRDFFERIAVPQERRALLAAVEEMAKADGVVDDREKALIESLAFATQGASAVDVVLTRLRGLFGLGASKGAEPFRHEELEDFRQHRLLYRLRRRLRADGLEATDRELQLVACWATLLARVAGADRQVTNGERDRIRHVLAERVALAPPILDLVVGAVCDAAKDDLDRSRSVALMLERTTAEQRVDLVEALFQVATADGSMEQAALREVRAVSKALQLSDGQFADAKARAGGVKSETPAA